MKQILFIHLTILFVINCLAQDGISSAKYQLPKVFLIGQYESYYNELAANSQPLVSVCDDNVKKAYLLLFQMSMNIQKSAFAEGIDLNGVKCWIHFFWNPDGSIKHIAYYLKPTSANISTEAFTAFLTQFAKNYRLPIQSDGVFDLYTSLSFPVLKYEKPHTSLPPTTLN